MSRFFITTPIYYVNDAPHVGHAYSTVNADALARWHRLNGDEVLFLTGTDEHGAKVAEAATERGLSPQDWADTTSQRFVAAWADLNITNDDFIRTSEPRHHRAVRRFLQAIYDNGYIERGLYKGLYCVSCEDYYTEEQLVDGMCPVHGRPVIAMEEENYFFKLSAFEERLLQWYEDNPEAVRPAVKRNEALGFIKGGLRDISITRTSLRWGVPVPWDERHVFYVWYDALVNYITAIGYGHDPERFAARWPAVHHLIGKEIIRFHCVWWPAMCMAAGIDPPANVFVHGWLLVGGQKLSKTLVRAAEGASAATDAPLKLTEIAPATLTADFGVDPVRYHLLREVPLGSDGDFSYESIVNRYNADLANNLGNLMARVATVVGTKCGGTGPDPDPASPLAAVARATVEAAGDAWERFAPHEALEATWRLIGAANAELEATEPWKAEPGPAVDGVLGSALEVLRIVALLITPAMPSTGAEIWRRLGLPGRPAERRLPLDGTWGGYPGGLAVERGRPSSPVDGPDVAGPEEAPGDRPGSAGEPGGPGPRPTVGRWFDSHCHLQEQYLPGGADDSGSVAPATLAGAMARAGAEGVDRLVCVGTDAATSGQALALAGAVRQGGWPGAPAVWATAGVHPHEAAGGTDGLRALLDVWATRPDPSLVAVGECGLDYFYEHSPRAAQREAFAEQIALAASLDLALVVHAREAWDDLFDVLAAEGVPERTILHCFTGGPEEARRCLAAGMVVSFSGIITFKNAAEVRAAARLCPLDRLLVETDSPFLSPVPHRGSPNEPARVPLVGAAVAAVKGLSVAEVAEATAASAARAFALSLVP